jgi:hypothetical protein
MNFITKTLYLEYLNCAKNTWLKLHKPELAASFELSAFEKALTANGNLVESYARQLFPNSVLISEFGESAVKITSEYIAKKQPVIFQATFIHDKFLARNDVLEYDKNNDAWNLYEIKGTNTLDESNDEIDHVEDATFQTVILKELGLKVGRVFIIHLNKEYVRGDNLNIKELFTSDDIAEEVLKRLEATKAKMTQAAITLFHKDEKALDCKCIYNGRSRHCSTFHYSHPEVPEYSIHDLARIGNSKKKLLELVNSEIYDINDIPEGFKLSEPQQNQADVHKSQIPKIDTAGIKSELDSLVYPLYFFDYETYPSAIPLFKGYKPYQQMPFQFSLHVLESPDSELKHFEHLHLDASDPTDDIINKLKEVMGDFGSIIVWNKKFEKGRNEELAARSPENKEFLDSLNNRIYDLMDIFQKQFHVHPEFKGKVSIKKVLPVLVPELSYKDLEIRDGGAAMDAWFTKIFQAPSEEEKKLAAESLLKYCYLDTYAMYAIWRELRKI